MPLSILLLLLIGATVAQAQPNNAITLSAGFTTSNITPGIQAVPGFNISTSTGAVGAVTWNRVVYGRDLFAVSLDLPLAVTGSSTAQVGSFIAGVQEATFFLTPGAQFKMWPGERMEPFVSFGAGLASVGSVQGRVGSGITVGSVNLSSGLGLGLATGVDVKLVKFLYFRPEFRRFSARVPGPDRVSRFNSNALFTFGLGFHF